MRQRFTDDQTLDENKGQRGGIARLAPDPSPEEILAAAEAIRASWTPLNRRNRHYMGEYQVRSLEPVMGEVGNAILHQSR